MEFGPEKNFMQGVDWESSRSVRKRRHIQTGRQASITICTFFPYNVPVTVIQTPYVTPLQAPLTISLANIKQHS